MKKMYSWKWIPYFFLAAYGLLPILNTNFAETKLANIPTFRNKVHIPPAYALQLKNCSAYSFLG